jgi:hypothetical protein
VNLLCNRVLLAAYLATESRVTADAVETMGEEMRGELTGYAQPVPAATNVDTTTDDPPPRTKRRTTRL